MTSLSPEDIPGAILKHPESMEKHSVLELQRWLECRGLKKVGSKAELISRIENCIKAGNEDKIFLGVDGGKWYDAKARAIYQEATSSTSSTSNTLFIDQVVWGQFPSHDLPRYFNKGNIYTYLIGENIENEDPDMSVVLEDNTVSTVKPFRKGHQYVDSDHINSVEDGIQNNFYVCRCKCLSSFQKSVQYEVKVILNNISGIVVKGFCECKQSALGKCSHVSAFLIFICEYIEKFGPNRQSATSQPRQWGLGSKKRNPAPVNSAKYPMKRFKPHDRIQYDPRPADYVRQPNINNFIADLQKRVGKTSMFQSLFHLKYENFEYSADEVEIIKIQVNQFIENLKKKLNSDKQIFEITDTSPQGNDAWLKWRSYFITSSNAKIVATQLKSDTARKNFLLKNLWMTKKTFSTVAMKYGTKNEPVARIKYSNLFLEKNERIVETGLIHNKEFPYFASSPDGVVMIGDQMDHIIEIKCPKTLENCKNIFQFDTHLTKKQLNNFFLEKRDKEISIKNNHPYLFQIIMSLIVLNMELCMLVVWCPANMISIPVYKKDHLEIVKVIKANAPKFYYSYYVPEMFTMRTVRDLPPISLNFN